MVRFTLDERTRQVAMLDDDRFEVLDVAVRPESRFADRPLGELREATGAAVGAIVRDGDARFPDDGDELRAGDRVIAFVESERLAEVERAL
jgi:trk system potassium uptake protein TrkA